MRMKRARSTPTSGAVVPGWVRALRRDPAAKRIVAAWRELCSPAGAARAGPGADTVVACSGGADSSALVLALAAAVFGRKNPPRLIVAHVVHDLRPIRESEADRDAAARLAKLAGVAFVEARVHVRSSGENLEAGARKRRYAELARLAAMAGAEFVATAHHADDQLETVLIALMRGAGPRGLRGVRARRILPLRGSQRVMLIRPMLAAEAGRDDAERICRAAEWSWQEDATNADISRLRSAVRHRVVPVLKHLRPAVAARACATARIMADADFLLRARAARLWRSADRSRAVASWSRGTLRGEAASVLGELVRLAAAEIGSGRLDRIGSRALAPIVRAIRDRSTEPRRLVAGPLRVDVTARRVTITTRSPA